MKKNKITVEVLCPSVSGNYDFILDAGITVRDAAEMIASEIRRFTGIGFLLNDTEKILLYSDESTVPYDHSLTLEECGISGGSRIMLIQERKI